MSKLTDFYIHKASLQEEGKPIDPNWELQPLMANGRLLIISTSSTPRQSKMTAYNRNKYICEVADEVLFVGANENSSLYPLKQEYGHKAIM
jgi:hypothetical protein